MISVVHHVRNIITHEVLEISQQLLVSLSKYIYCIILYIEHTVFV